MERTTVTSDVEWREVWFIDFSDDYTRDTRAPRGTYDTYSDAFSAALNLSSVRSKDDPARFTIKHYFEAHRATHTDTAD